MLRLSIRRKLAVALAVPLTAMVMVTVLQMLQTARAAARLSAQTELARAAIDPSGIITALQNERAWLGALLVGQQDAVSVPVRGTDETRAQTNAAIEAFRDQIARRDTVVREAFRPALQNLDELNEIRAHFDAEPGPRALSNIGTVDDAFARYTALIEPLFQGTTRVALVIDDLELRQGAELADVVARQSETFAVLVEKTISVATTSPGGVDTPDEISEIARLQSSSRSASRTSSARASRRSRTARTRSAPWATTATAPSGWQRGTMTCSQSRRNETPDQDRPVAVQVVTQWRSATRSIRGTTRSRSVSGRRRSCCTAPVIVSAGSSGTGGGGSRGRAPKRGKSCRRRWPGGSGRP